MTELESLLCLLSMLDNVIYYTRLLVKTLYLYFEPANVIGLYKRLILVAHIYYHVIYVLIESISYIRDKVFLSMHVKRKNNYLQHLSIS